MGKYKRTPDSRPYQDYSLETLMTCLESIRNKELNVLEASEKFGIPRRTLYRKLEKQKHGDDISLDKCGHPNVFTPQEEESFVQHVLLLAEFDMPITRDELQICVKNYLTCSGREIPIFKNNTPGKDWVHGFLERHPILHSCVAENAKLSRVKVTEEILRKYIENLTKTIDGCPPENIYNFDETNLTDNPDKKKVLVKRGCKYPELIQDESKVSTSLITSGTASGELLPLYVVYKSDKVWSTWTENGPPGTKYDCSSSGWFDRCTFENWFMQVLLPNAERKYGTKVVICDNLSSHPNEKVLQKCRKHNIKFVFLPANTIHIAQPLDVAFFTPMKRKWTILLQQWKLSSIGQRNATLPKSEFPSLLRQLWNELLPTASVNLQSGFKVCGVVPPNVEPLLARVPKINRVDITAVGRGFIQFLEDRHKDITTSTTTRKRKAAYIVAGCSVWSSDNSSNERDSSEFASLSDSSMGDESDTIVETANIANMNDSTSSTSAASSSHGRGRGRGRPRKYVRASCSHQADPISVPEAAIKTETQ